MLAAVYFASCGKQNPPKKYVAKVNDSYLTKDELLNLADTSNGIKKYKSEIIRDWINREVLYKEASKKGITKEKEYRQLVEDSQKELAGSMLLKKYFENENPVIDTTELIYYYEKNSEQFKLHNNSFLVNRIDFYTEDDAVQFRSAVLAGEWNEAVDLFKEDKNIIGMQSKLLIDQTDIRPLNLFRILNELLPDEVSIVIQNENNDYSVVQLLNKYEKGTIPPLDVIKDNVKKRLYEEKKKDMLNNYIKDLYTKYDIEVKN